jgi:predicted nucleotidyltransferase
MINNKQLMLKMVADRIKEKDPLAQVILFGSRARNDANIHSDWDILILLNQNIVSRKTQKEYRDSLYDLELETGEPISTLIFSKKEWEEKHKSTPLYINVIKDGIYSA